MLLSTKFGLSEQIFTKSLPYKFSWKSIQWEPRWCVRTDGRTWRS